MVFIITGAAESTRNTVGRLLAEALGWEFIDAENLCPADNPDARECSTAQADADSTSRVETLSVAINFWIYEWRDVVVSCPMLTEKERSQLCKMSSLIKIACLQASHATERTRALDRSVHAVDSEFSAGWQAPRDPRPNVLTVDSSRQVEEIIAEMTAALIMSKSPWVA